MPTRIDLQRYKKTYPFIRREPREYLLTERPMKFEVAEVSFAGSDTITYSFTSTTFTNAPKVTVSPLGTSANFNVYVQSVTSTTVVIRASTSNSESVHIHAIEVL